VNTCSHFYSILVKVHIFVFLVKNNETAENFKERFYEKKKKNTHTHKKILLLSPAGTKVASAQYSCPSGGEGCRGLAVPGSRVDFLVESIKSTNKYW